jgi:hypothetical protein
LVSTSSFMLGILGGLLDFASATGVVVSPYGSGMMNQPYLGGYLWAAILAALGVFVIAVALLSVTTTGMRHLRAFSLLMAALGVLMAVIGTLMSSGAVVGSSLVFSYGMVIVGILMAINGAMMIRTPMPM